MRDANGQTLGVVKFKQQQGYVVVTASVRGLSPGFHGFHVHANSDPANGFGCIADPAQPSSTWFVSADGHYRVGTETHGAHQGDMPILLLNGTGTGDSTARTRFRTDRFAVADISGRAIIVHALADNFANIPLGANTDQYTANGQAAIDKTAATGNAGDRILCGLVQVVGPLPTRREGRRASARILAALPAAYDTARRAWSMSRKSFPSESPMLTLRYLMPGPSSGRSRGKRIGTAVGWITKEPPSMDAVASTSAGKRSADARITPPLKRIVTGMP
jgi:Cu-Zn family superoxide dismutase